MRYLAAASAIVILAIALLTRLPHASSPVAQSRYAHASATPGPPVHPEVVTGGDTGALGGPAPWALSALPECFRQRSHRSGTPAFAAAGIPAGARPLAAGTRLRIADCTLVVAPSRVLVRRGDDRYYVPPPARLYRAGRLLILVRETPAREDVRVYEPTTG